MIDKILVPFMYTSGPKLPKTVWVAMFGFRHKSAEMDVRGNKFVCVRRSVGINLNHWSSQS